MATQTAKTPFTNLFNTLHKYRSVLMPIMVMGMLGVIVVPLNAVVMDVLITANIALAIIVLLTTLSIEKPLEFSAFPSLLLGATLFRLVLNIASTRLILGAGKLSQGGANIEAAKGVAGKMIEQFADFVAGNSLTIGVVIFLILVIVQFVVITKGATRISEVAARFTLDGMPGKQMAIDADLNAGIISEGQAKERRQTIANEADFYGAMDGAAKFVRGDAVAGIIITVVNIVGGFSVGMLEGGMGAADAMEVFTNLTIGDGLVSQLPAFVISIAAGLIVTRSGSDRDLGSEITSQLTARWVTLALTSSFLLLMMLTPLRSVSLLMMAVVVGAIAFFVKRNQTQEIQHQNEEAAGIAKEKSEPKVEEMLGVDTLELEIGYGLVKLVDVSQGGTLLDRITMIRRQLAGELGLVMPPVRIRDNMQHQPNEYHIKIRGNAVAKGIVYPDHYMAMDSGFTSGQVDGVPTREPAFGLDAVWIDASQKQRAESFNYTVVDDTSVLATHITEVVKNYAAELLTREETNNLVTQLKEKSPKLVEEVLAGETPLVKLAELQRVLHNLLRERVSIRDIETVVETLGDWITRTKDLGVLTEYVRNALRRTICSQYVESVPASDQDAIGGTDTMETVSKLFCISLDPALEDQILGYIDRTEEGTTMSMPPAVANQIAMKIVQELQNLVREGHQPVVLASPQVRGQVRDLIEPHLQTAAVLGYNEITKGVEVESMGLVQVEQEAAA